MGLFPWVRIPNLYSISECHDVSCSGSIFCISIPSLQFECISIVITLDLSDACDLKGRTYCPVGKLFPMVRVLVMDENLNEKLPGDAGEVRNQNYSQNLSFGIASIESFWNFRFISVDLRSPSDI